VIRVLVVNGSTERRLSIARALLQAGDVRVVGETADPHVACEYVALFEPEVVVLDDNLPDVDGPLFLQHLTRHYPARVVWSGVAQTAQSTLEALDAGASAVISSAGAKNSRGRAARELIAAVRGAAATSPTRRQMESRVGGRHCSRRGADIGPCRRVIGIGASTGGTSAVEEVVQRLAPDTPPVLIVQHLPEYMVDVFAQRLRANTSVPVVIARHGATITPGMVVVAPGNAHMTLERVGEELEIRLTDGPRVNGQRPAIDALFASLSRTVGADAIGVLLTGAGRDGAAGLLAMRIAGARTLVQDEASSLVWAMPQAAVELGAAQEVLPLDSLVDRISQLPSRSRPTMMAQL
jgi:two-component system, chemotaxis family, protein-glutamate methylesterase/glutaminase